MSIALTCDCGARYEVEDLLAGQEVKCPECQHPARVPAGRDAPRRASLLALFSLVLAIAGAFTLVGSAAGAVLALVALGRIRFGKVRQGGQEYAIAALAVAAVGAAATVGLLYLPAASALVGWQRRIGLAARVDTRGPAQVGTRDGVCVLTRPAGWGRLLAERGLDPAIGYLQDKRDVILAGPRGEAYIDLWRDDVPGNLSDYRSRFDLELNAPPPRLVQEENQGNQPFQGGFAIDPGGELPDVDGYQGKEWVGRLRRGSQGWSWLLRAYRKRPGIGDKVRPIYVFRAYAASRRFPEVEAEMKKALDGVRFPP